MNFIPNHLRIGVFAGLALFLLGGVFVGWKAYLYLTSDLPLKREEVSALEQNLKKQQAELKKLAQFVENLNQVKRELKESNLQLETALEHMPRTFNLASLLRKISLVAQNAGLTIHTFKPSEKEEVSDFYRSLLIDCELSGTFTQHLLFFDQLSHIKRVVHVDQLEMAGHQDKEEKESNEPSSLVKVTLKAYRFNE